jgi:hypothetical protein
VYVYVLFLEPHFGSVRMIGVFVVHVRIYGLEVISPSAFMD